MLRVSAAPMRHRLVVLWVLQGTAFQPSPHLHRVYVPSPSLSPLLEGRDPPVRRAVLLPSSNQQGEGQEELSVDVGVSDDSLKWTNASWAVGPDARTGNATKEEDRYRRACSNESATIATEGSAMYTGGKQEEAVAVLRKETEDDSKERERRGASKGEVPGKSCDLLPLNLISVQLLSSPPRRWATCARAW